MRFSQHNNLIIITYIIWKDLQGEHGGKEKRGGRERGFIFLHLIHLPHARPEKKKKKRKIKRGKGGK